MKSSSTNVMAEKGDDDSLSSLFKTKFKRKVVRAFCKQLRDFGNEAMRHFEVVRSGRSQRNLFQNYLTCIILKYEEIENENFEVITAAKQQLRDIRRDNYKHYLLMGRLVVVKHHWFREHAEERVLDFNGKIQRKLQDAGVIKPNVDSFAGQKRPRINLFQSMTNVLTDQPYVICIYSHYIPCTNPEHISSNIISEFATNHNEKVIVSYDGVFSTTSRTMATEIMIGNDNVITMNPQESDAMPSVQGRRYGRSKRKEFGCLYLDGSDRKEVRKDRNKNKH